MDKLIKVTKSLLYAFKSCDPNKSIEESQKSYKISAIRILILNQHSGVICIRNELFNGKKSGCFPGTITWKKKMCTNCLCVHTGFA